MLSIPIYYLDISSHANSVIDFIFLGISYAQVIYCIEPDLWWPLDYASFIVNFLITLENI